MISSVDIRYTVIKIGDYIHKNEIRKIIKWCKTYQNKPTALYPDYWDEIIDKLQELIDKK